MARKRARSRRLLAAPWMNRRRVKGAPERNPLRCAVIGRLPRRNRLDLIHAARAFLDREIHARAGLDPLEIDGRRHRKLHCHGRPADLRDRRMADVDLVLGRVDCIDRAGAVRVVLCSVRHVHFGRVLPVRGRGFTHSRCRGQRSWFGARRHRTGAAEIDPERHRGSFFRDCRGGAHAGDEGDRRQAHHQKAVKSRNHLDFPCRQQAEKRIGPDACRRNGCAGMNRGQAATRQPSGKRPLTRRAGARRVSSACRVWEDRVRAAASGRRGTR